VPYEPGTLAALAKTGNREISDEQRTAGPAFRITLESDTWQVTSGDPGSLAYITASVVDESGEIVPAHIPQSLSPLTGRESS
jgi:beta-galactosidase